jgi:hypothetical protein
MKEIKRVIITFIAVSLISIVLEVIIWDYMRIKKTNNFLSMHAIEADNNLLNDKAVFDSNFKVVDNKIYYERMVYHPCCEEMELQLSISDNKVDFFEKKNKISEKSKNYGRYECAGENNQICFSKLSLKSRSLKSGEYFISVFNQDELIFSKNINIE